MANDGELDALIIRNLEEIEQGYDRIHGEIKRRLDQEAANILDEVADEAGWSTVARDLDEDFWLANPAWQLEEGPAEEADFHIGVSLDIDSKGPDVSWAQALVGGQGSRALFKIYSDPLSHSQWLRFLKEDGPSEVIRRLSKNSRFRFDPDNKKQPLALPVRIEQEKLAQAFSGDIDFEEALAPLAAAVQEVVAQDTLLNELAALVRSDA